MTLKNRADSPTIALTPLATLGGSFSLTDQNGKTVTESNFKGRPALFFFGFTHCPDVCPTTLYMLSDARQRLGFKDMQIVFVSVDPERDTSDALKNYVSAFSGVTALTGTQAQIDVICKKFHVFVQKVQQNESYTMDHTATIFALNANGQVVMLINYGEAQEMVDAKLKRLASQS